MRTLKRALIHRFQVLVQLPADSERASAAFHFSGPMPVANAVRDRCAAGA
jgi:hypothetical protein